MADQLRLRAGDSVVAVDPSLVALAEVRSLFAPFEAPRKGPLGLTVVRKPLEKSLSARPIDGGVEQYGAFVVHGQELWVDVPDQGLAAIAAIRLGYHLSVARQGGVMLHSSAVDFDGKAILATGASGAGKSTLARLLNDAGGRLLSDEINALFPDGTIYGTPFRSDLLRPGSAEPSNLKLVLALRHAASESLAPLPPTAAMKLLASQAFRPAGGELSFAEVVERISAATVRAKLSELSFRPLPQAAQLLKETLRATGAA